MKTNILIVALFLLSLDMMGQGIPQRKRNQTSNSQTTTSQTNTNQSNGRSSNTSKVMVSSPSGNENGHGYVDLGLSVKWATMNVGATSPEGYGYYYAWGETSTKDKYEWASLKYCLDSKDLKFSKYVTESYYGAVDNKATLDLSDDAAHVNWGGSWRMPTKAEQDELRENCNWVRTTLNGIKGYKVTSKSNGNSLFLPAAGFRSDSNLRNVGSWGYYWSSSLDSGVSNFAYGFYFGSSNVFSNNDYRFRGLSVRPVCP